MRGHIRKRGSSWCIVVDVGHDENGKRRQRWQSGFRTKKEAETALTEALRRLESGTYTPPTKVTLGAFILKEWLPAVQAIIRPNTWAMYEMNVKRHVIPALGSVQLAKLTPDALNAFYRDLLENGRQDGRGGLSPRTVQIIHRLIRKALADAVRWGKVPRNVADFADPPRPRTPEMSVWTASDIRGFLEHVRDDRLFAAWLLAATTGIRRSELLGLRWSDVDLGAGRVSIVQTLTIVKYQLRFAQPKTTSSRRTVSLDPATTAALKSHRASQAQERLVAGPAWQDSGLVFTREDGSPIHPERFSKWFDQRVRAARLPKIRFHDVRHSYATAALSAGEAVKVVSGRLGHANTAITQDLYMHFLPEMDQAAADRVAAFILGE